MKSNKEKMTQERNILETKLLIYNCYYTFVTFFKIVFSLNIYFITSFSRYIESYTKDFYKLSTLYVYIHEVLLGAR